MSNAPIMSITEELVAELEFDLEVAETTHQLEASVSRDALAALLAERAELKRDADRYRWLIEACDNDPGNLGIEYAESPGVCAAIDAAMQSEAKP